MYITTEEYNFRLTKEQIKLIIILGIILLFIISIVATIHVFNWGTLLGLLALNIGLGVKTKGAVTVAGAVFKAGGKKAIAVSAGGMLFKRHIIDLFSKFFAEHSVNRYKKNVIDIFKMKLKEIQNSTPIQRAKAIGTTLLSVPIVYLVWSKIITTGFQKIAYAIVYPIVATFWSALVSFFGAATNFIGFLFQVLALNWVITKLEDYTLGKKIVKGINNLISFLGDIMYYLNSMFIWIGFDPKHKMIVYSIKLNRYLESILDDGLNKHQRLQARRDRHTTIREALLSKRIFYKERRKKHKSLWKKTKIMYRQKVKKSYTWKEKRERNV